MTARLRADRLLVERGLFESRAKAQAAIAAGLVTADGAPVAKPSAEIAADAVLCAEPAHPWVSRGGLKLIAALDRFGFDPTGCVCLDVGASTGGFTDVLLARGARLVVAVDVGRGQLHQRLRRRPEVMSLEATDVRNLEAAQIPERADLVTIDVSFISRSSKPGGHMSRKVWSAMTACAPPSARRSRALSVRSAGASTVQSPPRLQAATATGNS
jgi:23S rRNA (cytidine1920-2'-O)/16S rRNA (cytidine1409-2'-O)-methyltransferase